MNEWKMFFSSFVKDFKEIDKHVTPQSDLYTGPNFMLTDYFGSRYVFSKVEGFDDIYSIKMIFDAWSGERLKEPKLVGFTRIRNEEYRNLTDRYCLAISFNKIAEEKNSISTKAEKARELGTKIWHNENKERQFREGYQPIMESGHGKRPDPPRGGSGVPKSQECVKVYILTINDDGHIESMAYSSREKAFAEFKAWFEAVWKTYWSDECEDEPTDDFYNNAKECFDKGVAIFSNTVQILVRETELK